MSISKSNEYSQTEVMLQGLKSFENKQSVKEKDPINNIKQKEFKIFHYITYFNKIRKSEI